MDRKDFISMLGIGGIASVIPIGTKEEPKQEVITSEDDKDYEELYQIFQEGKPVEIGGIKFMITNMEMNADHFTIVDETRYGRKEIRLDLVSTGR